MVLTSRVKHGNLLFGSCLLYAARLRCFNSRPKVPFPQRPGLAAGYLTYGFPPGHTAGCFTTAGEKKQRSEKRGAPPGESVLFLPIIGDHSRNSGSA
jgi:hypothetical protein